MDYLKPLLRFDYWFGYGLVPFFPWVERVLVIFMSVLVVAGIATMVYLKLQKGMDKIVRRMLKSVSTWLLTAGLSGLLLYWFYYESIPVLSMRFLYVIWLAIFGWWKFEIYRDYKKARKGEMSAAEKHNFEKWLPKPKH